MNPERLIFRKEITVNPGVSLCTSPNIMAMKRFRTKPNIIKSRAESFLSWDLLFRRLEKSNIKGIKSIPMPNDLKAVSSASALEAYSITVWNKLGSADIPDSLPCSANCTKGINNSPSENPPSTATVPNIKLMEIILRLIPNPSFLITLLRGEPTESVLFLKKCQWPIWR